jgi:hypothetical protein
MTPLTPASIDFFVLGLRAGGASGDAAARYARAQVGREAKADDQVSSHDLERAGALADRVLALQEPWAGRFSAFVASQARRGGRGADVPSATRSDLAGWLLDLRLDKLVRALLHAWSRDA